MTFRQIHYPLIGLIFSSHLCAHADIVGGESVADQDLIGDAVAGLYQPTPDGRGGALCTASVISKNTAITAAHCIDPHGTSPIIIFGRDLHSPDSTKKPVTGLAISPLWRTHQGEGMDQGDIALVKFPKGLPKGYHPIPMDRSAKTIKKGKTVTLAGYGISDAQRKTGAGTLRKTRVRVDNPRPGKTEMILDQSRGSGACHGDSGGPAFVRTRGKQILVGVTNRSYPASAPDDCAHKVVYTKVSAYRRWIEETERRFRASPSSQKTLKSEPTATKTIRSIKRKISRRLQTGAWHRQIREAMAKRHHGKRKKRG